MTVHENELFCKGMITELIIMPIMHTLLYVYTILILCTLLYVCTILKLCKNYL